jgi:hypothetical protein
LILTWFTSNGAAAWPDAPENFSRTSYTDSGGLSTEAVSVAGAQAFATGGDDSFDWGDGDTFRGDPSAAWVEILQTPDQPPPVFNRIRLRFEG